MEKRVERVRFGVVSWFRHHFSGDNANIPVVRDVECVCRRARDGKTVWNRKARELFARLLSEGGGSIGNSSRAAAFFTNTEHTSARVIVTYRYLEENWRIYWDVPDESIVFPPWKHIPAGQMCPPSARRCAIVSNVAQASIDITSIFRMYAGPLGDFHGRRLEGVDFSQIVADHIRASPRGPDVVRVCAAPDASLVVSFDDSEVCIERFLDPASRLIAEESTAESSVGEALSNEAVLQLLSGPAVGAFFSAPMERPVCDADHQNATKPKDGRPQTRIRCSAEAPESPDTGAHQREDRPCK